MKKLIAALVMFAGLVGSAYAQLTPYAVHLEQVDVSGTFFWGRYMIPSNPNSSYLFMYDGNTLMPQLAAIGSGINWTGSTLSVGAVPQSSITGLSGALAAKFDTPTGSASQYVRGDGVLATLPTAVARSYSYPTRALSTCFQISAARDAHVSYAVDVTTTVTLGGTPKGSVYLRTYTNSACSTGQQTVVSSTSGMPATLSVTVGLQNLGTASLAAIPAGSAEPGFRDADFLDGMPRVDGRQAEKQMTTETQDVATSPETENKALDTTKTPETVEPGSTDDEGQKADSSEEAKSEKTAEQKELERLRRQVTKSHRTQGRMHQETVELRERLAQLEQAQAGMTDGDKPKAEIDPVKLAREIATIERVTEKANAVAKDGQKRFSDFNDALTTLREEAGDLFDKKGLPTAIGEAILDADDPAALIHFLGANDDLAAELEGLSPAALGRRIAKYEARMNAEPKAKPLSKASEPIAPLKGTANAAVKSLEQMSQAEYEAHRKKSGARWAR
jgi:hypothetical protein